MCLGGYLGEAERSGESTRNYLASRLPKADFKIQFRALVAEVWARGNASIRCSWFGATKILPEPSSAPRWRSKDLLVRSLVNIHLPFLSQGTSLCICGEFIKPRDLSVPGRKVSEQRVFTFVYSQRVVQARNLLLASLVLGDTTQQPLKSWLLLANGEYSKNR